MKVKITFDENKYIEKLNSDANGDYEIDDDFNFNYLFCYQLKNGKLVLDVKKAKAQDKQEENLNLIEQYKKELNNTDFIIVKSMEYQLSGLEIPYDIEEIHKQRQELRDKINKLEV